MGIRKRGKTWFVTERTSVALPFSFADGSRWWGWFSQVLELRRAGVYCVFEDCDIDEILAADYADRSEEPEGFMSGGHPM
jgi:hypothetical protein